VPPRGDWRDRDPYWQIWDEVSRNDPNYDGNRTGYLEHRDLLREFEFGLDLDEQEKRQFWADYNLYMVSHRTDYRRSDPENPFWGNWNISPDDFDWHGWREAMGYPHGNRR
jgi:hypothetical protein